MLCQNPPPPPPRTAPFGTRPLKSNTYTTRGLCTSIANGNTTCRYCVISTTRVCERSGPYSRKVRHPRKHQRNCLFLKFCKPNLSVASAAATALNSSCSTAGNQHCRIVRLVLVRLLLSTTRTRPSVPWQFWRQSRLSKIRRPRQQMWTD